ncbi:MAG: FAD-dependent thymidylate synthase [Clostridia bacterium]|nr:FAD-dependent thymidylate synthase [Clostridia bacterium]
MHKNGAFVIGVTNCDEEVCAASGRISTQNGTALEIFERSHDKEKNANLINKVTKSGHTSTVEHIFFNLAFQNVSVVVEQFMIEFRLASFTVKSRRYVDFSSSGYLVPEFTSELHKTEYTKTMDKLFALYSRLTESGVPKEDARFVLPYCFYSNFFCSLNGRELVRVLTAMIYGRGKKVREIYDIGLSLLESCRKIAPGLFTDFESRAEKYSDGYDFALDIEEDAAGKESELCEILSHSLDGEMNVAKTAIIEKYNISTPAAEKALSADGKLKEVLSSVVASSRPRALEAYNCTVRFNGVSLSCLTHFARHRMQNISIPNLITASREKYIIPKTVKNDPELLKLYCEAFSDMKKLYTDLKAEGYDDNVLIYCVLSGNTLDIVTTMNAREMLLFFKLRSCTRAQWEIQEFANDFLKKLRRISPDLFSLYGPSCYTTGVCPEGKLTCGRAKEIKEKFKSL